MSTLVGDLAYSYDAAGRRPKFFENSDFSDTTSDFARPRSYVREAVKRSQLTGNSRFSDAVEQNVGRRVERRGPGRPIKIRADEVKVKDVGNG